MGNPAHPSTPSLPCLLACLPSKSSTPKKKKRTCGLQCRTTCRDLALAHVRCLLPPNSVIAFRCPVQPCDCLALEGSSRSHAGSMCILDLSGIAMYRSNDAIALPCQLPSPRSATCGSQGARGQTSYPVALSWLRFSFFPSSLLCLVVMRLSCRPRRGSTNSDVLRLG